MKINVGLLGLVAAQSGDDQFEDNSYDYDISSDRWSNENQYSLDEANAGITFGVMARVTKQQDAKHFQKALKLSCWNSNMIRDMNNDNKFSVYFNDQVEYKRFHPGISAADPSAVGGTVDTTAGHDDLSWLYAVGDLRTGYNHQYGFEHSDSDPYTGADATNRLGVQETVDALDSTDPRNNNRLRQLDEKEWTQSYTAGAAGVGNSGTKTRIAATQGIRVDDENHSVRPDQKWSHRKWGYQSDNVERAQSGGYTDGTVVYHFGHHDNTDNEANRPNMRFAANSVAIADEEDTSGTPHTINEINMVKHEFDFHGFKDDWRYSLRMGGCLYEAARWVYDESSFHRTGRLTYTDDTLFMDDPFNPNDGTDIFGAHANTGVHTGTAAEFNGTLHADNASTPTWNNAGSTNTTGGAYQHGDCNGSSCQDLNVATPSSGGVFADVHWVHVFNAHIFPLQDVGYYQYDQTLGIGNVNENNDSITSRDGYGYNIYTAYGAGAHFVMRDVWGAQQIATYIDTANNAPPGAALDLGIDADEFHSQYGTVNIGNIANGAAGQQNYSASNRPNSHADDFIPILTKTRRKIEDFNVVMANPTYEGHGFLNFVATYHDHTENFNDTPGASNAAGYWIRQVGKRFLSTIGGLTTASNAQRLVCRAVKDGIDSYRMNGFKPALSGTNGPSDPSTNPGYVGEHQTGTAQGLGHDDPFLAPLGPGPAGNYGNGQRCGAAMYENFGDWFLRPAQTYSAYNKFEFQSTAGSPDASTPVVANVAADGWNQATCSAADQNLCLGGMESYNYWAFILSEGYNPISGTASNGDQEYMSEHELWRNGSLHYDRRGEPGVVGAAGVGHSKSSGRGFAISSFPHNELGKDFRFNIRTLHNMGNGVAKQYYQISELTSSSGNEFGSLGTEMNTLRTSNLRTSETVWSYYFYAVDTIKIAFPEFVARVNHCDRHSHRNTSHCMNNLELNTENGNPDNGDITNATDPNLAQSDGLNRLSAYPGYRDGLPHRRLGFQDIIIDGVTMKKTDNQYDSRNSRTGDNDWHKQYNFARGLRGDDHTRATLHYLDTEFANEDKSLDEDNSSNAMCGQDHTTFNMNNPILFYGANDAAVGEAGAAGKFQGYADSYQPLKPCASWCALDTYATTVATGFGVDSSKQTLTQTTNPSDTLVNHASMVDASTSLSQYGGICGRVLRIDGLLQTYDELHNRQYGTIQEIWVQLQYAYQESMDNSERSITGTPIRKVQSPFPNVFFSAPEVVDIRGFCPSSNMKCRGYMSDQHQPYGGSRNHKERVHWNDEGTRFSDQLNAFGANQLNTNGGQAAGTGVKQSGNDWTMDRDFRGDSKWPWNYHSYTASDGVAHGGTAGVPQTGTQYTGRDYNHIQYKAAGAK